MSRFMPAQHNYNIFTFPQVPERPPHARVEPPPHHSLHPSVERPCELTGPHRTFPPAVQEEIFACALEHDSAFIRVLVLVARDLRYWVEYKQYRTVSVCAPWHADPGRIFRHSLNPALQALLSSPSPFSQQASYVRHLTFTERQTAAQLTPLLAACTAVRNLHLGFVGSPVHLPLLGRMKGLTHLAVLVQLLFPPPARKDFSLPAFANITHLEVRYYHAGEDWADWASLAVMPRLTHLAFHGDYLTNEVLLGALAHCPRLEVLVNLYLAVKPMRKGAELRLKVAEVDPRIVVLLVVDPLLDWEWGVHGGRDYWVRADQLVRRRSTGISHAYVCKVQGYAPRAK